MIHIYTFCDKTLVGKKSNNSAKILCENLYKMNFKIEDVAVYCNNFDYASINFKNKDIYFLFMQKSNQTLNSYLANLSGCELKENETLRKVIEDYYNHNNLPLENKSELEWTIPENAICITNPNGKTQGYSIKIADATLFVLPNEVEEFKQIFNDCLLDYIERNFSQEYLSETYKTFGISEDNLYLILKEQIKNKDKVSISIFSRGLDNDVVVKAKTNNEKFEEYRRLIFAKLERYIYSVNGMTLVENFERLITKNSIKISLIGDVSYLKLLSKLTPKFINAHINECQTLPNKNSKIKYGIDLSVINQYGEVSSEVAYNLAINSLDLGSDLIVVSLCELNGENRGLTFIAIGNRQKIDIYKNVFCGTDDEILNNISSTVLFYVAKKVECRDYKTI